MKEKEKNVYTQNIVGTKCKKKKKKKKERSEEEILFQSVDFGDVLFAFACVAQPFRTIKNTGEVGGDGSSPNNIVMYEHTIVEQCMAKLETYR